MSPDQLENEEIPQFGMKAVENWFNEAELYQYPGQNDSFDSCLGSSADIGHFSQVRVLCFSCKSMSDIIALKQQWKPNITILKIVTGKCSSP